MTLSAAKKFVIDHRNTKSHNTKNGSSTICGEKCHPKIGITISDSTSGISRFGSEEISAAVT